MSASTQDLAAMVSETAEAAADTSALVERTRGNSLSSNDKLQTLESGFRDAVSFAEAVHAEIDALAARIQQTEGINEALRDLADQLRMLAVNAGLEAAKAGEDGRGFSVIAAELRRMIASSSEDLARSRQLLAEIGATAAQLSSRARKSTESLRRFFAELQETSDLIDAITQSFAVASERVGSISDATRRQQNVIRDVSDAMRTLDTAARELTPAASELTEGMRKLARAHGDLRESLDGRQA
ncbi:MAG: methyl-accepting chemotaxis protein [Myxococcales bacterium]